MRAVTKIRALVIMIVEKTNLLSLSDVSSDSATAYLAHRNTDCVLLETPRRGYVGQKSEQLITVRKPNSCISAVRGSKCLT